MLSIWLRAFMPDFDHRSVGVALSNLILDLFRVSSRLTTAGDRLVAELGLTSARWQILGSMAAAERAQPVAWLARDMGASRQNIQRIVHDLERDGLVAFSPNPHHRRAHLVGLTEKGRAKFAAAMLLQTPWIDALSEGLDQEDVVAAHRVMSALGRRLDRGEADDIG
jgi:DNA-binding MarR family transcriptional regulator